jgi:hypothetical protein
MKARMTHWHETKTKKYHALTNRIADSQSASSLLKLAAEAWLESHCANSSLYWNFRRRSSKKLSPIAQSMPPNDVPRPFTFEFRTIMARQETVFIKFGVVKEASRISYHEWQQSIGVIWNKHWTFGA